MLVYILKFSACLGIFLAFYKLFLERENMHQFKRFYLVAMLLISAIIPFITFTQYVEPTIGFGVYDPSSLNTPPYFPAKTPTEETINYLPIILWSIYGIGVLLFGLKFGLNLSKIITKIKKSPKLKSKSFINVLLNDLITPHTFFNYIFLNKHKYETHQIPQEVLLHEQTHARQKHSIDVLFIELFQILFWFNPLIHIVKNSIKLNHEFLADKAVLSKGIGATTYQQILLAFSTNQKETQLANAINYSSIKKRLTVMKTQTSKQKIWLRNLILLPLLALTLYSFSERKEVVIEYENPNIENITLNNDLFKTIWVSIHKDDIIHISNLGNVSIEDFENTLNTLNTNLTLEEKKEKLYGIIQIDYDTNLKTIVEIKEIMSAYGIQKISIKESVWNDENLGNTNKVTEEFTRNSPEKIAKFRIDGKIMDIIDMPLDSLETININGKTIYSMTVNGKTTYRNENRIPVDENGIEIKSKSNSQDGASRELMKEYNKLAKKINNTPEEDDIIIKLSELKRLKYIYSLMSDKQKKDAEPFPNIPPPPPPPKTKEPQKPNWLLINSKGQMLFNDDLTTLKTLDSKIKSLYKNSDALKVVSIKVDNDAPKDVIGKAMEIMNKYDVKIILNQSEKNLPPPPPPIPDNATKEQKENYKKAIAEYALLHPGSASKTRTAYGEVAKVIEMPIDQNGTTNIDGEIFKYTIKDGNTTYFNNKGKSFSETEFKDYLIKKGKVKKTGSKENLIREKLAYKEARAAKLRTEKAELVSVRELNSQQVQNLKKEKLAYKEAQAAYKNKQKLELTQVREMKKAEIAQLRKEKMAYAEAQKAKLSTKERLALVQEIEIPKPPKSPLDHVIDMAKKDAIFYLEGEKISSDKAIKVLKKNKSLNIQTIGSDSRQPKVYITKAPIIIKD